MSSEGKEHFIQTLHVHDAYSVKDLDIPIGTAEDPRHLLLTGPNGSGKSTILRKLAHHAGTGWNPLVPYGSALPDHLTTEQLAQLKVELGATATPLPRIARAENLLFFAPPSRTNRFRKADGPRPLHAQPHNIDGGESQLLQYLVNLRTEAALAREDGDDGAAEQLSSRLRAFEHSLDELFGEPLELRFERTTWTYTLRLSDGRETTFSNLPDGFASVLNIWSGLILSGEALRKHGVVDPPGWAILDEPETHLHASLQERVLPFLAGLFPRVQFIVATHSPAVLASLRGATVFDLRTREAYPSEELRGIRYGTILTEHFGISSDFDLETTRALQHLHALYLAKPKPGSEEFRRMRELADSLGEVPHVLKATVRKLTSRASDSDD